MHALMLGIAWGLLGLDVGWRPAPGGGVEYIIQIAPHELELFKQNGIEGDIPPQLRDIRMYRVVVGNDVLPRQDPPPSSTSVTTSSPNASVLPPWSYPSLATPKAYNPFASLSSLVSRYPFSQTPSESVKADSSKATPTRQSPRSTDSDAERWWRDGPTKVERPGQGSAAKEPQEPLRSSAKPWLPFTVVVLALFGSLGGNLYMGWITWETRAKYHALVRRFRKRGRHSERTSDDKDDDD